MNSTSKKAVILFAKDPVPGQVKTRLQTVWDAETTCQFYLHILKNSIDKICGLDQVDRFVGVYPSRESGYFEDIAFSKDWAVFDQEGDDLGARMQNAFRRRFEEGYEKVVILGADSPTLPSAFIEQALHSDRGIVLGPSTDGGYYLIGMTGQVAPVFSQVDWGTDRVLGQTLQRLKEADLQPELLPVWYDVDRPEDVRFLKTHLEAMHLSGHTEYTETQEFLQRTELNPES